MRKKSELMQKKLLVLVRRIVRGIMKQQCGQTEEGNNDGYMKGYQLVVGGLTYTMFEEGYSLLVDVILCCGRF